jgi:hypothetical protein
VSNSSRGTRREESSGRHVLSSAGAESIPDGVCRAGAGSACARAPNTS